MGTQRGVVQTRRGVFPGGPPEGLRGSLADAPQKFEQVDGGAESAVAVDQGPEEQGPDRDRQAEQAIPQPRHRAGPAAGPAALRGRGSSGARSGSGARQPARRRARPASRSAGAGSARASPRAPGAAALGRRPVARPRAPALTVRAPGPLRPARERRWADPLRCGFRPDLGEAGTGLPPQSVIPVLNRSTVGKMKGRLAQIILGSAEGSAALTLTSVQVLSLPSQLVQFH